jgi:hypothetical protein
MTIQQHEKYASEWPARGIADLMSLPAWREIFLAGKEIKA